MITPSRFARSETNQVLTLDNAVTRREFLRTALRWTLLMGSVGTVGALVTRRSQGCERIGSIRLRSGSEIESGAICGSCPLLTGCKLPPAQSLRQQPANAREKEQINKGQ